MKKLIIFSTLFFLINFSFGKPINQSTAKKVGLNFILNHTKLAAKQNVISLDLSYISEFESINYFYIFNVNKSEGFVIISSDDIVCPVLGYSEESSFTTENIAPNVVKWLDGYKQQISFAIQNNLVATDEINKEWQSLLNGDKHNSYKSSVSPLISTKWDQSPYYNSLCPSNTVTGCVATAMAQVMKFWNYPAQGSGFHSYNHNTYGTLSANFGNTTYQWTSMPNIVNSSNNAVATLMYHCGVSVDMNYGLAANGGSGAQTLDVVNALKTYFGYPSTVEGKYRTNYTESQWKNLLKAELNVGRPIQYAGTGSGGGHSFVCDGYDNNDYFHFNWGWSGQNDGYFNINALNPGSLGTGGGTGGFNSNHRAIIGIEPPSSSQTYDLNITTDVTASQTNINYGNSFYVTTNIENNGTNTFVGDYCAAIFDQNDNFVDYVGTILNTTLQGGYTYTNNISFNYPGSFSLLPGTYTIYILYRPTGGNWQQINASSWLTDDYATIHIKNAKDIEVNSTVLVNPSSGFTQGQSASVNFNIVNDGSNTFYGMYSADLYKLDGTWVQEIGTYSASNGLPSGYTYNSPYITVSTNSITSTPGSYLLVINYKISNGSWQLAGSSYYQNPIIITVKEPALQADIYEMNDNLSQSYNLPISFSGNNAIKNTVGSNCHNGSDYDYYKITLPTGYNYSVNSRLHDSYNSGNGNIYTLDALYSYSTDGITWSNSFDDIMTNSISINNGGTIYFHIAPYFSGETGTYLFDLNISRTIINSINETEKGKVLIYPNPVKDYLYVRNISSKSKIIICDINGKELNNYQISENNIINVSNLSNGFYLIKVIQNDEVLLDCFIKE